MKKSIVAVLAITLAAACTKSDLLENNVGNQQQASNVVNNAPTVFGAWINCNGIDPSIKILDFKKEIGEKLSVSGLRDGFILTDTAKTVSSRLFNIKKEVEAGYRMFLNVNWGNPADGAVPFPTDLVLYRKKLVEMLNQAPKLELLVVENEEYWDTHTGPLSDYINELKIAIQIAHNRGIKVTNGGFGGKNPLLVLTYENMVNKGLTAEAADFALRQNIKSLIKSYSTDKLLIQKRKDALYLLKNYNRLSLDYVNFHYYEKSQDGDSIDEKGFKQVVDFLKEITGKPVITNEIGQTYSSPKITETIVRMVQTAGLPYAIFYSGNGPVSYALHNTDGTLRPEGVEFSSKVSPFTSKLNGAL